MSTEIAAAFSELFYGSGCWLGILLLETIIWSLALKKDWAGVVGIIVSVFMGINYLTNTTVNTNQVWLALIMFFTAIFLMINLVRNEKK